MIKKVVRITKVEEQDATRRVDMLALTPARRVEALVRMRDRMFPGWLDKGVVHIRTLPS